MYDVLMIDPPWPISLAGERRDTWSHRRDLIYPVLTVEGLFVLLDREILSLAANSCSVFLWGVDQFLFEGERGMETRGFRRHARFVWDKGNGYPAAFTVKYSHEYLTWFYRGGLPSIAKEARGKFSTVIRERRREHSRKPDAAYWMIERLYPEAKRIDVFSREARPGWDQWGNEPNRNVHQLPLLVMD